MSLQRGPLARMQRGDFNPAAHPRGDEGRFVEAARQEPAVLDLAAGEGSYAFPPSPTSAAGVRSFWASVPIGDEVLERTKKAFDDRATRVWREAHRQFDASTTALAPTASQALRDGLEEARTAHCTDELARQHAFTLEVEDVRPVVRATRMWADARRLPSAARDQVLATLVSAPRLGRLTVAEVVARHRSDELLDAML